IRDCLRRAWALVARDFWPVTGVTAVMLLLVGSNGGAILGGPPGRWALLVFLAENARPGGDRRHRFFRIQRLLFTALFCRSDSRRGDDSWVPLLCFSSHSDCARRHPSFGVSDR